MADIADIATESIETALANTIQNIRRFEAPSLFEFAAALVALVSEVTA